MAHVVAVGHNGAVGFPISKEPAHGGEIDIAFVRAGNRRTCTFDQTGDLDFVNMTVIRGPSAALAPAAFEAFAADKATARFHASRGNRYEPQTFRTFASFVRCPAQLDGALSTFGLGAENTTGRGDFDPAREICCSRCRTFRSANACVFLPRRDGPESYAKLRPDRFGAETHLARRLPSPSSYKQIFSGVGRQVEPPGRQRSHTVARECA